MENLTYEEFINNILETRGRFACGEEYHERHHIVPRCMGGGDEDENLIDLFAREHFIAHKLLADENPDNHKLIYAYICMAFVKRDSVDRYELCPDEYEEAKILLSKTRSEDAKQRFSKIEERNKQREIQKKRFEDPAERVKNGEYTKKRYENIEEHIKQSEIMKKKYEDPEMRKKTSIASKKMWQNEEYRQKQIEIAKRTSQNPEILKARSEGSKKRWNNPDAHKIHSDRMSGAQNPRAKKVVRLSDNLIYGCMQDAAVATNISVDTLRIYCKRHNGFMFYDEWLIQQNNHKEDENAI